MKARREMLRSLAGWRSRRRAIRAAASAPPPAPFVVGATRSGTTLLRLMLDAHPELATPSETHFIPELIAAREKHGATPSGCSSCSPPTGAGATSRWTPKSSRPAGRRPTR